MLSYIIMVQYLYVSVNGSDSNDGTISFPVATVNKAIMLAQDGDIIEIAPGRHTTISTNTTINKSVTINGPNIDVEGISDNRIEEAEIYNYDKITIAAGKTVTINGIKFLQTNDSATDLLIIPSNTIVKNCIFERIGDKGGVNARALVLYAGSSNQVIQNNLFTGSILGGLFGGHTSWQNGIFKTGGDIDKPTSGVIQHNVFKNCRTAINLDNNNKDVEVLNNRFESCGTYIALGGTFNIETSAIFENNIFSINTVGSALVNNSTVSDSLRVDIINNIFEFNENNVLKQYSSEELSLSQKMLIESRMFHKGRSNRSGIVYYSLNEQVVINNQTTISKALSYAVDGEVIQIAPGTYNENVRINKSGVSLVGLDKETTIISSDQPIQLIQGSSGTTIQNISIVGKYASTENMYLVNDPNNIYSGINVYTEGNINEPINNIVIDNVSISRCANGINFNNPSSRDISISNCVIEDNAGAGIRIARNVSTMDGFTVDNCIIRKNNLSAITSNPSDDYRPNCTNYVIKNTQIHENNRLTFNNSDDISILSFNGNLEMSDVDITCNHAESKLRNNTASGSGGWGLIIYGSPQNSTFRPSGDIKLNNVVVRGNVVKSVLGIDRYLSYGNVIINNVDIRDCKTGRTWHQARIGNADTETPLYIGTMHLKTLNVTNIGDIDARDASFYHIATDVLLNKSNTIDVLQLELQINDRTDNGLVGKVLLGLLKIISELESRNLDNTFARLNEEENLGNVKTINLLSGNYEVSQMFSNTSSSSRIVELRGASTSNKPVYIKSAKVCTVTIRRDIPCYTRGCNLSFSGCEGRGFL